MSMREKEITSQESIAIIDEMIRRSRTRRYLGDGNIFLLWGYLTAGVAALVWILLAITGNPAVNWLWFLIWIIGGTLTPRIAGKRRDRAGVTTYADKLGNAIWSIVGYCAIVMTFLCLGFFLFGGRNAWGVMLLIPLLIVGMAEIMQGVVIRERSLVYGGAAGVLTGTYTVCCLSAGVTLGMSWYMPLFIISVAAMMIIPGHILNRKSDRER